MGPYDGVEMALAASAAAVAAEGTPFITAAVRNAVMFMITSRPPTLPPPSGNPDRVVDGAEAVTGGGFAPVAGFPPEIGTGIDKCASGIK